MHGKEIGGGEVGTSLRDVAGGGEGLHERGKSRGRGPTTAGKGGLTGSMGTSLAS